MYSICRKCTRKSEWLAAVQETPGLWQELEKTNQSITVLEAELNQACCVLDKEKKKQLENESNSTALEKKLQNARYLVFVEGCGKVNDETKEKLRFLNTACNSFAGND
jgi:hypothetical protein